MTRQCALKTAGRTAQCKAMKQIARTAIPVIAAGFFIMKGWALAMAQKKLAIVFLVQLQDLKFGQAHNMTWFAIALMTDEDAPRKH